MRGPPRLVSHDIVKNKALEKNQTLDVILNFGN